MNRERAKKTGSIGCRCSNGITSMPFSSITITRTSGRIRCLMGDRTKKAFCIWAMDPGARFANQPIWMTRPYLAVADESYHLSVHRIEGRQQFHVALSDTGRVVDVCTSTKRAELVADRSRSFVAADASI